MILSLTEIIFMKKLIQPLQCASVVLDAILGRLPGDVWGHDTFQNAIKKNVDICFSGKTIKYEATFITPQTGKRHLKVVFRPLSVEPGKINTFTCRNI